MISGIEFESQRDWIMPRTNGSNRKAPASVAVAPMDKLLVSQEEAAQLLSISKRSVEYLVASRRLSTRRIGTRALIPIEDVRRFARADHPENMAS
jgi:excisionase family DNA binding protein